MTLDSIESAIAEIKAGRPVIVVDDLDRENEGDFIMAAEKMTPHWVNFMAKEGRGIICACIEQEEANRLQLPPMTGKNSSLHETAFTISVDHIDSGTGISATDRALTIQKLLDKKSIPSDFVRPGHIFPLIAKDGGTLYRDGHTEASVDLARLAGLEPAGVICEIMNDDGSMARRDDLFEIAKKLGLKMVSIEDLKKFRKKNEDWIKEVEKVFMPVTEGNFDLYYFEDIYNSENYHLALVHGDIKDSSDLLVRMHSECLTGDAFGSLRCDCGQQLEFAKEEIVKAGKGVILYLKQEGRGIGLKNKLKAYRLQEDGLDTIEANLKLGFKEDLRDYSFPAKVLEHFKARSIRLMTNNPEKIEALKSYGVVISERVDIGFDHSDFNKEYLETKKNKMGHYSRA